MNENANDDGLHHDPIAASLTTADDRILLSHWMPPQSGIIPVIRFGKRWYSVLWALPIVFVLLVAGVAVAQALRQTADVQAFLVRYPGAPPGAHEVTSGFPIWLRVSHFLNLFFMVFIIRAGVQILADHPRLYWQRDCTPGSDWSASRSPCLPAGFGPPRTIPSLSPDGWASPASVILLALPAGGTFRSTRCGY